MKTLFCLLDTNPSGQINQIGRETLSAARAMAGDLKAELAIGLFGETADQAATVACAASEKIYCIASPELTHGRYATDCAAIEALCKQAQAAWIVAPANARLHRALSGVAFRLSGRIDTHVSGYRVEGEQLVVRRWYYKQRMEGEQKRTASPWFVTIDAGNFSTWDGKALSGNIQKVPWVPDSNSVRTKVEGFSSPGTSEQTIRPDSPLLFVAGAGWTKKQSDGSAHGDVAAGLILGFLRKSQASLGGSKSIVDISGEGQAVLPFMTHLNQIGQTGASPRHPKGLATCCHGEEPHVIGWRFIRERRAINLNANCGWAQGKADVLYVADAFAVMAKVNELL